MKRVSKTIFPAAFTSPVVFSRSAYLNTALDTNHADYGRRVGKRGIDDRHRHNCQFFTKKWDGRPADKEVIAAAGVS